MNGAPKLLIEGASKRFGSVLALAPTTLEVKSGEFLTLLGPSGSGKTTLLNLIAGLLPCDSGRIFLDGRDITYASPQSRGMGMVFQNYALFPHLTVAQNIAFGLDVRGQSEARMQARVNDVLAMVRLQNYAQRLPKELSGGQQQRVALARAFAYGPHLILMDEPLGALDRYLRDEMKLEIARLHKEMGTTVVYVTHDQEEALVLSDRVCLMNHARVEQTATAQSLYFKPQSRFAAEFLGESNLLKAQVGADGQTAKLDGLDVQVGLLPDQTALTPGTVGWVLLRPEGVRFTVATTGMAGWTVSSVQFLGPWLRISVVHSGGSKLTAVRPCVEPVNQSLVGQPVTVQWPTVHFIPESPQSSAIA
jgi:putative spermidine/putrescine transport system ATP-binding protein